MASSRKESSPYLGVQKPKSDGYAVEKRCFLYQGEDYGKFYHRIDDESRAAFISDVVDFFSRTNESKFNFGNSRKVLEAHGPRLQRELKEALVSRGDLDRKERREKVRDFLIHEANELWNEYKGEILKDHIRPLQKGTNNSVVEQVNHAHEDSVQEQNHTRLRHMGSSSNVVEQVNHVHEDSVQEEDQIQPRQKGINNNTSEQLDHGYEECLAGGRSMTKQIEEPFYDNGGFLKFDIDVGLLRQPPPEEPKLKKKLPIPPLLKEPQGSCFQTQENPYEGIDARGRKTQQNLKSKMEQRCDGYAKWWEITENFLKSTCSQVKVSDLLDQVAPHRKALPTVCAQIQCSLYEEIFDEANRVIDSECIPKEILDKYRLETEPIVKQCRANWHS